jgi:ATP/ADP translocase
MRLARIIFIGAGIWGIVVLTPLYWLVDVTGRHYPPPNDYPQFFYGFIAVAIAWQMAFLLIGSNPVRYRTLMIMAMIEKFSYVTTLAVLFAESRISAIDVQPAIPDGLLGILFVVAFFRTRTPASLH